MALILVIDDEPKTRQMVRRVVMSANHVVIEAEDGEAGLRRLQSEQPALVVTDILMPNKEGIETITDIRRISPTTKIIAMSGAGPTQGMLYLDAAEKLGADAVLPKPFRATELLDAVDRLLASR